MAQASLELILSLTDQASKELASVRRSLSEVGEAANSAFGWAKGGVIAGIGGVVAAVGSVGAAVFGSSERLAEFQSVLGQGFSVEQFQAINGEASLLEQRFGFDLPSSLDATRQLVANGLVPDMQSAFDVLTAGAQNGLNVGGDLLDTFREYSPTFAALGIDGPEALGIINRGLEAGARNSDVAADAVKEFGILIREPGTLEAVSKLDAGTAGLVDAFQSGKIAGDEAFSLITQRLGEIQDPILQNTLGVALFGTKWEDMNGKAILAMGNMSSGLIESAGAADAAQSKIGSLGEIFPRIGTMIQTAFAPAIPAILEIANSAMPAIQSAFAAAGPIIGNAATAVSAFVQTLLAGPNPLQGFVNALNQALPGLGTLVQDAAKWGSGLVSSFAQGMVSAFSVVVSVLQQIGSVISYWLQPHSPPKILPGLDQWGADAATVYMEGWGKADYSALQTLGGGIKQALDSLVDVGALGKVDVIPTLLGSRGAIAGAISQMHEVGSVSEETIQQIVSAAGPAGGAIEGFTRAYFDLAQATTDTQRAQEELNRVTAEYDAQLAPLTGELKAIQDQKRAIDDQIRVKKLQEDIASGKLDDLELQRAQLEIAEVQQRAVVDAAQAEKDAAVDAAQQKVDAAAAAEQAAQVQFDAQQAQLQAFNEQNQLLGQQAQLLEQIAAATESASKAAAGGGGGGIAVPAMPALGGFELPAFDATTLTQPLEDIKATVGDAGNQFYEFKDSVVESMLNAQVSISPVVETIRSGFATAQSVLQNFAPVVAGVVAGFAAFSAINATVGLISTVGAVLTALTGPIGLIVVSVGLLTAAWTSNFFDIQGKTAAAWGAVQPVLAQLASFLTGVVMGAAAALVAFWSGTLQPAFSAVGSFIGGTLMPILASLASVGLAVVTKEAELLGALWSNVLQPALAKVGDYLSGTVMPALVSLASTITAEASPAIEGMQGLLEGLREWLGYIGDAVDGVIGFFNTLASTINGIEIPHWLQGQSPPPLADWLEYISESAGRANASLRQLGETLPAIAPADMQRSFTQQIENLRLLEQMRLDALKAADDDDKNTVGLTPQQIAAYAAQQQEAMQAMMAASAAGDLQAGLDAYEARSDYIATMADLQRQLNEAQARGDTAAVASLQAQMNLQDQLHGQVLQAIADESEARADALAEQMAAQIEAAKQLAATQREQTASLFESYADLLPKMRDLFADSDDARKALGLEEVEGPDIRDFENAADFEAAVREAETARIAQQDQIAAYLEQVNAGAGIYADELQKIQRNAQAMAALDPEAAKDYFDTNSRYLFELADLQQDLNAARALGNVADIGMLEQQLAYMEQAYRLQRESFAIQGIDGQEQLNRDNPYYDPDTGRVRDSDSVRRIELDLTVSGKDGDLLSPDVERQFRKWAYEEQVRALREFDETNSRRSEINSRGNRGRNRY